MCNFTKTWKGSHPMGNSRTGLKFSITIDYYCKFSKLSTYSLFKNISKISILDLNKRSIFWKFCLIFKEPPFQNHKVWNPSMCNSYVATSWNEFWNFASKNEALDKSIVKININKKLKKNEIEYSTARK